jgi:hypothetical protein
MRGRLQGDIPAHNAFPLATNPYFLNAARAAFPQYGCRAPQGFSP